MLGIPFLHERPQSSRGASIISLLSYLWKFPTLCKLFLDFFTFVIRVLDPPSVAGKSLGPRRWGIVTLC